MLPFDGAQSHVNDNLPSTPHQTDSPGPSRSPEPEVDGHIRSLASIIDVPPELEYHGPFPIGLVTSHSTTTVKQVQLWIQHRQLCMKVGRMEEQLGQHVHQCVRITRNLSELHHQIGQIEEQQAEASNGDSKRRALEYFDEMEQAAATLLNQNCDLVLNDSKLLHQPPMSPLSRAFQRIGALFYRVPSLMEDAFARDWNHIARTTLGL